MKTKKYITLTIDEQQLNLFDLITTFKRKSKSSVIEELIRNYNVINKAELNEYILNKEKNI